MRTYPSCITRNRDLDPKLLSVLRKYGIPTLEELWDIGEAKSDAADAKRKAEEFDDKNIRPLLEKVTTGYEDRNTDLFFDIADIVEFSPERYDQETYGEFRPGDVDQERFEKQFGYDSEGDQSDTNWILADKECGSALCVAGHAAALNGWFPTRRKDYDHPFEKSIVDWYTVSKEKHQLTGANGTRSVEVVAQELLGISNREAEWLFDTGHKLMPDDLRGFGKGERILPEGRSNDAQAEVDA